MSDSEKRQRGVATFEEVMGFKPPPLEGDLFLDQSLDHLFAEVWSRPGLSIRERRLVTLTILSCGGHESHLRLHLGAAMKSGHLSDQEIDEFVLHIAHYGGWPVAAIVSGVARELRAERDKAKPNA